MAQPRRQETVTANPEGAGLCEENRYLRGSQDSHPLLQFCACFFSPSVLFHPFSAVPSPRFSAENRLFFFLGAVLLSAFYFSVLTVCFLRMLIIPGKVDPAHPLIQPFLDFGWLTIVMTIVIPGLLSVYGGLLSPERWNRLRDALPAFLGLFFYATVLCR
jgi:hypothetical protein